MRKLILFLTVLTMLSFFGTELPAVPALPRPVVVEQADGSVITILIHGDERFHYTTTSDGYLIAQKDGIYYHASAGTEGLRISGIKAHDPSARSVSEQNHLMLKSKGVSDLFKEASLRSYQQQKSANPSIRGLNTGFPTKGEIRSLVILVNFTDCSFESPTAKEDFYSMLNQEGYAEHGATGSAKDYYVSNSLGQFQPTFDVVGPVTVSHDYAYYGKAGAYGHDDRPDKMIEEACELADTRLGVNFADYDYNNDGLIDNVFVFYAGVNEAEGGGSDRIWPHRAEVVNSVYLDGKRLYVYACTSEFCHTERSKRMAGIGTFCHEFGHVLSFSDLYDTDGASHGLSDGVWNWSIMCVGSYNNDGRTPPVLNGMERYQLGWTELEPIQLGGDYRLEPLEESNRAYVIETDTPNEYFVLENRQKGGVWDNYISGHGLLIFHVDKSKRIVGGINYSAADMWDFNMPNVSTQHECYRIIRAREGQGTDLLPGMTYPGSGEVTEFSAKSTPSNVSWSGKHVPVELFDIRENDGLITFHVKSEHGDAGHIEDIAISGRNEMILNDTVRFKALIHPEVVVDAGILWQSSDPETVSIDRFGVARALKTGSVRITATAEDGGVKDEVVLTVVDGQLFRAKVSNSSGIAMSQVRLLFNPGGKYVGLTDESGVACIENIPEGKYEVELIAEGYPVQTKKINIFKGVSMCDITILTEKELKKGAGLFEVEINSFGTYAFVTCSGSSTVKWAAEYYPEGNEAAMKSVVSDVPFFKLDGLDVNTQYVVRISEMSEVTEGDFRYEKFKTTSSTSRKPVILLGAMCLKGSLLHLSVGNLSEGDSVYWKVDGKPVEGDEFRAEAEEHCIEAVIEHEEYTEVISKYIQVKDLKN